MENEETKEMLRELIRKEMRVVISRGTWDKDTQVEIWLGDDKISQDSFYEGEGREQGCW